jgi:hypothetical protein
MAGIGFHYVVANRSLVPRIATVTSINLRADCQGAIAFVANCCTLESGLPRGYSYRGKPRYWSTGFLKRVKSITSHYTSTVPLFAAPYIFDARLTSVKPIRCTWNISEAFFQCTCLIAYIKVKFISLNMSKYVASFFNMIRIIRTHQKCSGFNQMERQKS